MLMASDVVGRQIAVRDGGQIAGKIKDLVVDATGRHVIGIVLSDGVFSASRVAPWKAIQAFGPDSVLIDSAGAVAKADEIPEIKAVLDTKTKIKGLKLLTTAGKELGKITDFEFDETTGSVTGFELSGGLFSSAIEGNPFLPIPASIELGKDVAFVAPDVEATIVASGGLKAVFKHGDKPGGPAPAAGSAPAPEAHPEPDSVPPQS